MRRGECLTSAPDFILSENWHENAVYFGPSRVFSFEASSQSGDWTEAFGPIADTYLQAFIILDESSHVRLARKSKACRCIHQCKRH